jgi:hypothetical protein
MRTVTISVSLGLLTCSNLALGRSSNQNPKPTAHVPIEPFSSDAEILGTAEESKIETYQEARVRARDTPTDSSFGLQLRVQMTQEGFGGQFRLLQYARSWLAVTQTLRYFGNEQEIHAFDRRYGALLGAEWHPWRRARLSPFAGVQAGWERFERAEILGDLNLFAGEVHAGIELELNRFSSFAVQWVETTYLGLEEPLYKDQKRDDPRHAIVEVHFSMHWEKAL